MTPVQPVPAATLLMLRDAPTMQVFMAVRTTDRLRLGCVGFPGGKVTDDDRRETWSDRLDGDLGELTPAGIAAVRETFEESGLLLCRPADGRGAGAPLAGVAVAEALAPHRGAVDRGEQSFLDLVTKAGLVVALDRLVPFAHWITPEFMPKRFDTHFFLARAPRGQIAAHDGREVTDSEWLAPAAALDRARDGQATILFPTRLNLELLAGTEDVDATLAVAQSRTIVPVMPVIEQRDGEDWLTIREDAGYATMAVPIAKERAGRR